MSYRNSKASSRRAYSGRRSESGLRRAGRYSPRLSGSSPLVRWGLLIAGLALAWVMVKPVVSIWRVIFGQPISQTYDDRYRGNETSTLDKLPVETPPSRGAAMPPISPRIARFAEVDRFVESLPESAGQSLGTLVSSLRKVPSGTPVHQVRAAFLWVARNIRYDLARMETTQPEDVLRYRSAVCAGYAQLVQALCKDLGIPCETIAGFVPEGMQDTLGGRHAWNAVKIDAQWYLLDVTWASTAKDYEGFFLVPPEEFIFSHFPEGERWQFLDKPWARTKFDALPSIKPHFFKMGMRFQSHLAPFLRSSDTRLVFRLDPERPLVRLMPMIYKSSRKAALDDSIQKEVFRSNGRMPDDPLWEIKMDLDRLPDDQGDLILIVLASDTPLNTGEFHEAVSFQIKR